MDSATLCMHLSSVCTQTRNTPQCPGLFRGANVPILEHSAVKEKLQSHFKSTSR